MVTDIPEQQQPEVNRYAVAVRRCERSIQPVRGQHLEVHADQRRRMWCITAWAVRTLPATVREITGVEITQKSALTKTC